MHGDKYPNGASDPNLFLPCGLYFKRIDLLGDDDHDNFSDCNLFLSERIYSERDDLFGNLDGVSYLSERLYV